MRTTPVPFYLLAAASLMVAVVGRARAGEPPAGFAPLFNGKDLSGWRGGMYNNIPGAPGKDPLVVADRVTIWLNNKLVVDHAALENIYDRKLPPEQRRPLIARGPIQLQTHGGEIRWRNLFIREIGADEAALVLARGTGRPPTKPVVPQATITLFNGRDLSPFDTWLAISGFADPNRVAMVVPLIDGAPAIRLSGQHFGGIITKEAYANYRLGAEFRWGLLTWEPRLKLARDSGILLHGTGREGNYAENLRGAWMRSVEFQIIEGGTGDMLLPGGYEQPHGERIRTSITAPMKTLPMPGKAGATAEYWEPAGTVTTRSSRLRTRTDAEKTLGQWNRLEAIADRDAVEFFVNGVKVNGGTGCSLREGRILFQSEGA